MESERTMTPRKLRGLYIVTEAGCLDKRSGASQHIKVGLSELKKHFDIEAFFPKFTIKNINNVYTSFNFAKSVKLKIKTNKLIGFLRDLKFLAMNTKIAISVLWDLKNRNLDFVYLRAGFLDPLPLLLRVANIPCFIEANGLQFQNREKYYASALKPVNKFFERFVYSTANHVFFVGSYGDYWQLKSKNWINIENGVELQFLEKFFDHKKQIGGKIHLALIARLMAYHQPHVLISAIHSLDSIVKSKVCLHLIGSELDQIKIALKEYIEVIDHGFLDRDELATCLRQAHVGLIPGVPKYQSQMKLLDYGAAKCVALVPKTHNLQQWFDESELTFFEAEDPSSLAKVLTSLANNPINFLAKGERLHQHILSELTWSRIFCKKAKIIKQCCEVSNYE